MSNVINHILDPQYVGVYCYILGAPITVILGITFRRWIDKTNENYALKNNNGRH